MIRDIFSRQRISRQRIIACIIVGVLSILISVFIGKRELDRQDKIRQESVKAQKQQEREATRAEYFRRKANAGKQSPQELAASSVDGTPPSASEMTPDTTGVPEHPAPTHIENATDAGVLRYTEGPYKGMTYEEAITLWNKRKLAHTDRIIENAKKRSALTDVLLDSSKAERSVILSLFADLTPEQLSYAREVALENLPAKKVDVLLNDLEKIGEVKSLDQLSQEVEDILLSREAWEIADRELAVESVGIKEEGEELRRTKPTPP